MLMPVVAEVFGNIGITKDDVGFICSGSTDYLIGGPFSFVAALDAVGVWPPRAESHVEMDGAWALYEAWVLLQEGEIDAALVYAFGRSSMGDLAEILSVQLDPYYLAPLWPDPTSLAALQAQAMIDKGLASEADFAAVASRSRRSALGEPQGPGGLRPLARGAAGRGLRGGAAAPARPAAAHRRLRGRRPGGGRAGLRAVRAAGVHHGHRPPDRDALGGRPRPQRLALDEAGGGEGRRRGQEGRRGRAARALRPPGAHPRRGPGTGRRCRRQPLGWRAGGQPDDVGRAHPHRRVGPGHLVRGRPTGPWRTPRPGPCLQQNLVCVLEGV